MLKALPPDIQSDLAELRRRADQAFTRVSVLHAAEMACKPGCDDCCHAVFDLAPVEAVDLALGFAELPRQTRRETLRRADKAAKAFDALANQALSAPPIRQQQMISLGRIACPLLHRGRCLLYERRPLTCRLYGAPLNVGGQMKVCSRSHFTTGQSYPAVDVAQVQAELDGMSARLLAAAPGPAAERRDVARALLAL